MKISELLESYYCTLEDWKERQINKSSRGVLKFIKTKIGISAVVDLRTDGSYVFGGSWKSPNDWYIK